MNQRFKGKVLDIIIATIYAYGFIDEREAMALKYQDAKTQRKIFKQIAEFMKDLLKE